MSTLAMYNAAFCCCLFFCIVLIVMPLQLSHHYTHTSVSNIFTSHFIGASPQTEKYVEQVEKSFLEMKRDVGMSPHEK